MAKNDLMSYEAEQWLKKELDKLKPSHYDGTFFTIAHLRQMNGWKPQELDIVVPVEKWCNGETGFEVISINALAAQCPWDMMITSVIIDTGVTKIDGRLAELIDHSVVHSRIAELEKDRRGKEIGVYKSIIDPSYSFKSSMEKFEKCVSPGYLVMEE